MPSRLREILLAVKGGGVKVITWLGFCEVGAVPGCEC